MNRDDEKITVCAACLTAACWQAVFMCQASQTADVTQRTVAELRAYGLEHPRFWRTDEELANEQ